MNDVLDGSQHWWIENVDVMVGLASLPSNSIHAVVTSPPYFGLRSYGTAPQIWGAAPDCEHYWVDVPEREPSGPRGENGIGADRPSAAAREAAKVIPAGATCVQCGAWSGELGSEPDPWSFVAHLVEVFREVRRVLRPDGTCWLNIGDSYAGSGRGPTGHNGIGDQAERQGFVGGGKHGRRLEAGAIGNGWAAMPSRPARLGSDHGESGHTSGVTPPRGLKAKDLCLVPERLAIALQEDGWYIRQRIAWVKAAPMPEAVSDRPTSAWEYIWLLSKGRHYFYDADAIRGAGGANARNHWWVEPSEAWPMGSEPYPGAHFATFPTALAERCIRAGTSGWGVCRACGAPWRRVVEPTAEYAALLEAGRTENQWYPRAGTMENRPTGLKHGRKPSVSADYVDIGWAPTCECGAQIQPAVVLDPFSGAGTTVLEARRLGRRALGLELNPEYADLARRRVVGDAPLFNS